VLERLAARAARHQRGVLLGRGSGYVVDQREPPQIDVQHVGQEGPRVVLG
jgi:hypothetical protein